MRMIWRVIAKVDDQQVIRIGNALRCMYDRYIAFKLIECQVGAAFNADDLDLMPTCLEFLTHDLAEPPDRGADVKRSCPADTHASFPTI